MDTVLSDYHATSQHTPIANSFLLSVFHSYFFCESDYCSNETNDTPVHWFLAPDRRTKDKIVSWVTIINRETNLPYLLTFTFNF